MTPTEALAKQLEAMLGWELKKDPTCLQYLYRSDFLVTTAAPEAGRYMHLPGGLFFVPVNHDDPPHYRLSEVIEEGKVNFIVPEEVNRDRPQVIDMQRDTACYKVARMLMDQAFKSWKNMRDMVKEREHMILAHSNQRKSLSDRLGHLTDVVAENEEKYQRDNRVFTAIAWVVGLATGLALGIMR